ncbi:MAG: aldehyde dehydrogenase family protein, partial [Polyangiaceae bacterium]
MTSATVAGVAVETDHWIAGGPRTFGGERIEVRSPIDGALLAEVAAGDATAVDAAVSAARDAFPAWARLGPADRGALLDRFAHALLDRKEAFAQVETADNGSLLAGNLHRVVDRAAHNIAFFSGLARTLGTETHRGQVVDNEVHHDPAGVAALVTPWNAPLLLSTWKLGPALAAGNTVVLKAPEWAPLTCSLLARTATEVGIPPGVLNVVHGTGAAAGQALVDHPGVDRISFT